MFGILNSMFRRSTGTEKWNAPQHWHDVPHMSAYERQERESARRRAFLIRDRDLFR